MENLSINDDDKNKNSDNKQINSQTKDINCIKDLKFERTARWVNDPSNKSTLTEDIFNRSSDISKSREKIRKTSDTIWTCNIGSQKSFNTTTTEPLGNLDGASILSEYESYYTAMSEISQMSDTQSLQNTPYVLCRETFDNLSSSNESSILDLQDEVRMSEFEKNFFCDD